MNDLALVQVTQNWKKVSQKMNNFDFGEIFVFLLAFLLDFSIGVTFYVVLNEKESIVLFKSCPEAWNLGMSDLVEDARFTLE